VDLDPVPNADPDSDPDPDAGFLWPKIEKNWVPLEFFMYFFYQKLQFIHP
jgi:hypothetical protein